MSATIDIKDTAREVDSAEVEAAPKVPWLWGAAVFGVVMAILTLVKWYQHTYSWTVGLDSFSPEFQTYWMSIFYAQITLIPLIGAIGAAWLWFSRDRDVQALPVRKELFRYYAMFGILAAAGVIVVATLGLLTEADAAWHQVVIRDTDFTPTHIFLFYLGLPAGFAGLILAWIWVHTRLPQFANRVSIPLSLSILGFMMALPVVAFNEWGHTFFYAEELFASPVHWFFVLAAFNLVFLGGFVVQCLQRMREITQKMSVEEMDRLVRA
ncbi:MAG: methane monooxygenase/ammonia monooxygenase subunit C [Pseudomonadota bacterium]|nr:methane monooxygenase/ammonia monooxygenase subunit C [Pseudomonadota bacterium]